MLRLSLALPFLPCFLRLFVVRLFFFPLLYISVCFTSRTPVFVVVAATVCVCVCVCSPHTQILWRRLLLEKSAPCSRCRVVNVLLFTLRNVLFCFTIFFSLLTLCPVHFQSNCEQPLEHNFTMPSFSVVCCFSTHTHTHF